MIVVGYTADPFGRAALEHGIAEAKLRAARLLVINSTSGDAYADPDLPRPARSTTSRSGSTIAASTSSSPSPSGSTRRMSC